MDDVTFILSLHLVSYNVYVRTPFGTWKPQTPTNIMKRQIYSSGKTTTVVKCFQTKIINIFAKHLKILGAVIDKIKCLMGTLLVENIG